MKNETEADRPLEGHLSGVLQLLAALGVPVTVYDREGRFVFINGAALSALAARPEDLIGRRYDEVYPEVRGTAFDLAVRRIAALDAETGVEMFVNHYAAWNRWFDIVLTRVGAVIVCQWRDITQTETARIERDRALVELKEQQALLRAILTQMPGGLIVVNNAGEPILTEERGAWRPEDAAAMNAGPLAQALRGEQFDGEILCARAEGAPVTLDVHAGPVYDDRRDLVAAVAVFSDITEEKRLRDRQRMLIEHAPDAIFIADTTGRYTYVNRAGCELVGYEREALVGKNITDLLHPEDHSRLQTVHGRLLAGHVSHEEWTLARSDGSTVCVEITSNILGSGEWQAIARDISRRKALEAERARLAEESALERRFLERVLGALPVGVAIADVASREIRFHNEALVRIFGRLPSPFVDGQGRDDAADLDAFVPRRPDGTPYAAPETPFARALDRGEEIYGEEMATRRADGSPLHVRINAVPVRDAAGAITAALIVCDDITDKKLAQADLARREQEFRFLSDMIPHMVWSALPDGSIDYSNRRWYEFTGLTFEEHRLEGWRRVIHPEDLERVSAVWAYSIATGADYEVECRLCHVQSPAYRWFLVRAHPLRDPAGHIVKWFGTYTDIHDAKQAEAQVAAALERELTARTEAERASRFSEMFVGILGHDLRNPLSTIYTGAELLLRSAADDKHRRSVGRILASAERMGRMIEQLLDFTRIRLGAGLTLSSEPMNLGELARRIVEEIETAHPDCALRLELHGDDHGRWDGDRLGQVLSNLLGNAVHHGRPGEDITARIDGTRAEAVHLEVTNQGHIPPELVPVIFEPFRMGHMDKHARSAAGGLGLGLYITQRIVLAHQGTIEVSSSEEAGTTFRVYLPRSL